MHTKQNILRSVFLSVFAFLTMKFMNCMQRGVLCFVFCTVPHYILYFFSRLFRCPFRYKVAYAEHLDSRVFLNAHAHTNKNNGEAPLLCQFPTNYILYNTEYENEFIKKKHSKYRSTSYVL